MAKQPQPKLTIHICPFEQDFPPRKWMAYAEFDFPVRDDHGYEIGSASVCAQHQWVAASRLLVIPTVQTYLQELEKIYQERNRMAKQAQAHVEEPETPAVETAPAETPAPVVEEPATTPDAPTEELPDATPAAALNMPDHIVPLMARLAGLSRWSVNFRPYIGKAIALEANDAAMVESLSQLISISFEVERLYNKTMKEILDTLSIRSGEIPAIV